MTEDNTLDHPNPNATDPLQDGRETFLDSTVSTRKVLNRFDLNGDGVISPSEAALMANTNVLEEKEKKKYKHFFQIAAALLLITLMANFGLTIATIYLTRQFDIQDGTLVDRSTGKQVTTKSQGNLLEATLFNHTGRRLDHSLCFATLNMDRVTQDQTYRNFIDGKEVSYTTTADGKVETGVVNFIDSPVEMATQDAESVEFEMPAEMGTYFVYFDEQYSNLLDEKNVDEGTLVLYAEVECVDRSCPVVGQYMLFFMWCGGSPAQKLFDTGNCCLVGEAQLPGHQDMRRLDKCASQ